MMIGPSKPSVFDYQDYRQFLRDWYLFSKQNHRGFSFRSFSKKGGFRSPNFLKRVMERSRNLTESSLVKCHLGLGLNKQESDFFDNLVRFNQATTHEEKDRYYRMLIRSRKLGQLKPVEKEQYEYYSNWRHPVIRELVTSPDFDGSPQSLVGRLLPAVSLSDVEHSIALMERLGIIERCENGWRQVTTLLSSGKETASLVMRNYHDGLLTMIREQMGEVKAHQRDISALTLGVKRDKVAEIKKRIHEFREEILKLVAEDTTAEEVIVLGIQLLPVTRPLEAK